MPCYSVSPAYRRNIVHYNPAFFQPVQHTYNFVPRFAPAPASFFRNFEEDLAQFDDFFKEVDASLAAAAKKTKSFQPRFDIKEETVFHPNKKQSCAREKGASAGYLKVLG